MITNTINQKGGSSRKIIFYVGLLLTLAVILNTFIPNNLFVRQSDSNSD